MAQQTSTRCYFEIDGNRYGPLTCDLTESIDSTGRKPVYSWRGSFVVSEGQSHLPFNCDVAKIELEDGRKGEVIFTSLRNGASGEFLGQAGLA